jgi:glucokinase
MSKHLVAIDIGGSKVAVLARELRNGREVYRAKVPTPKEGGVDEMLRLIDVQIGSIPGGRAFLRALGVAVPGFVDAEGRVLQAGNLKGWVDVPLRSLLSRRYRIPAFVDQDANCAALGEKWMGAARDMDDFVFVALGTGVGAGLYLGGRIHRGARSAAGELGDLVLHPGAPRHAPAVSDVAGKGSITERARRITGEEMRAGDVVRHAGGRGRLARVANDVVDHIAGSVLAISTLLDPEAIVFGGGTSAAGRVLLREIRRRLRPHGMKTRLLLSRLGTEAQLYGALGGAERVARAKRPSRRK